MRTGATGSPYDHAVALSPRVDAELAAAYRPGDRFRVFAAAPVPALEQRGVAAAELPNMTLPAGQQPVVRPTHLDISPVKDGRDLAAAEAVLAEGQQLDPGSTPRLFGDPILHCPQVVILLGRAGGRPVATATAFLVHGVTAVNWVVTRTDARGRGYASALTAALHTLDLDRPTVLQASRSGERVYRSMGFRVDARLLVYSMTGSPTSGRDPELPASPATCYR